MEQTVVPEYTDSPKLETVKINFNNILPVRENAKLNMKKVSKSTEKFKRKCSCQPHNSKRSVSENKENYVKTGQHSG